ncbi:MAG: protoheme IX farnesyltransferase [Chlorobiota bacterium]|nr:MAG: protoheme IX farnesyltransferase [Chlorobiota bacterium]
MPATAVSAVSSQPEAPARARPARSFIELSKPGITLMEVVTAAVGYWVAQPWLHGTLWTVLWQLGVVSVGVFLLGASAGAFNHILERWSDAAMQRTSLRPLPAGRISVVAAYVYAWSLLALGMTTLLLLGWTVALLGVATVALYALLYTPLKTKTALALYLGGIPGALPVIGGWVAGGGELLSPEAAILAAIMFWWQLPHFLALAILYADDYRRGGIVLLGDGKANRLALHTLLYAVLLVLASAAWWVWGKGGILYALGCGTLSAWLLVRCMQLVRQPNQANGRHVLVATYMFLMGLFLLAAVDLR